MENLLGLLRIHIHRGINLAIRDVTSSDPYVVVRLGRQKLKTRVVKKNVNPEWNEDLTLSITEPIQPLKLEFKKWDMPTKAVEELCMVKGFIEKLYCAYRRFF